MLGLNHVVAIQSSVPHMACKSVCACREHDKAAKTAAKEEQKQERQKEKVENRASKGEDSFTQLTMPNS